MEIEEDDTNSIEINKTVQINEIDKLTKKNNILSLINEQHSEKIYSLTEKINSLNEENKKLKECVEKIEDKFNNIDVKTFFSLKLDESINKPIQYSYYSILHFINKNQTPFVSYSSNAKKLYETVKEYENKIYMVPYYFNHFDDTMLPSYGSNPYDYYSRKREIYYNFQGYTKRDLLTTYPFIAFIIDKFKPFKFLKSDSSIKNIDQILFIGEDSNYMYDNNSTHHMQKDPTKIFDFEIIKSIVNFIKLTK